MASDLSAPCLRCGRPASVKYGGEHHHPHTRMGGQGAKIAEHPRVVLCRGCHNAVHLGEWRLEVDGSIAKGYENDMVVFERGVTVQDDHNDSRFWSDERLASAWALGEGLAQDGFEYQCNAAFEFYRRYRGQPEWYVRVAEILSDNNGLYVHPREVYRRIKLYVRFKDDWTVYRRLGKTLALAIAESDDSDAALEIAQIARDEGGHTSTEIIRKIRGQPEPKAKTCPSCGALL